MHFLKSKCCKLLFGIAPMESGFAAHASTSSVRSAIGNYRGTGTKRRMKLVIIGGGAGGSAMASKFFKLMNPKNICVIEPWENHYYQPMWTLVGAGLKNFEQSRLPHREILGTVNLVNDYAAKINPETNSVVMKRGLEIEYEYLIVATGIRPNYEIIKGLPQAFETPGVCSNYRPEYVRLTYPAIMECKEGEAIFTFPLGPIKCAGAPQKIAYLADARFRQVYLDYSFFYKECFFRSWYYSNSLGVRDKIKMRYNTALPVIFGCKYYADVLDKVAAAKDIEVNKRHNLIEVKPESREAVFEILDENNIRKDTVAYRYSMLHVSPRCDPRPVVKDSPLSNEAGFVTVDKHTLQHTKYPNVFALGDCTDTPNAKTAAAVAAQCNVVKKNLEAFSMGQPLTQKYDGYTSCPLTTSLNKLILAEFDYDLQPLETFPFDQRKERWSMSWLKKHFMPQLYWHGLLRGIWNGPAAYRKIMHLGFSK